MAASMIYFKAKAFLKLADHSVSKCLETTKVVCIQCQFRERYFTLFFPYT